MGFNLPVRKASLLSAFDSLFEERRANDTRSIPRVEDIDKTLRRVSPILYLPVEVKAREFHAKALIARAAAEKGLRVLFGAKWPLTMNIDRLPPGIFLFKTMHQFDANSMVECISNGHLVAVLDEEMFGISASGTYIKSTVHPHAVGCADLICAQGPDYAKRFPYQANIAVTGTPRVETYKQSQGDDILVCLQSGNINNHGRSFTEMVQETMALSAFPLSTTEGAAWAGIMREAIAHECDVLPLVSETIDALAAAFPERRIVVRPHPVENPANWTFSAPNIVVDTRNNIIESLEAASVAVFVSGCTTGLDAYLAKVPAVRLGRGGVGISANMHTEVNTPAEAVDAVRRAVPWDGSIDGHLAPLTLTECLLDLYKKNAGEAGTLSFSLRAIEPNETDTFIRRKFPDTSLEEVIKLVGRPVQKIAWNLFLI